MSIENQPQQDLTGSRPTPRDPETVQADINDAKVEFTELHIVVEKLYNRRKAAIARYDKLKQLWETDPTHGDTPFDPSLYSPPAAIPPMDTRETREFHGMHYKLARLDIELNAAKNRQVF